MSIRRPGPGLTHPHSLWRIDTGPMATDRGSRSKAFLRLLRSWQSSGNCLLEAFPRGLGEGAAPVENHVGDVPCFVACPGRLGSGDPFPADGVVEFVVVGNADGPAVPAEPGARVSAGRRVVVRQVPEVELEIDKAPHVPVSRHGAGQVDGDRSPGYAPPGSDPTALMWCEVQDGTAWFLGNSGETCGFAAVGPPTRIRGAFGMKQPGADLIVAEMIGQPATLIAVELLLYDLQDAGHRPRLDHHVVNSAQSQGPATATGLAASSSWTPPAISPRTGHHPRPGRGPKITPSENSRADKGTQTTAQTGPRLALKTNGTLSPLPHEPAATPRPTSGATADAPGPATHAVEGGQAAPNAGEDRIPRRHCAPHDKIVLCRPPQGRSGHRSEYRKVGLDTARFRWIGQQEGTQRGWECRTRRLECVY